MKERKRKKALLDTASLEEIVDRLERDILMLMRATAVPGVSVTLIRSGEIAWSGAFGVRNRDTQEPVTSDTLFEAASLSKPLFAFACLRLCAKGLLDLDAPLVDYVPDRRLIVTLPAANSSTQLVALDVPQLRHVTVRHVLSHTTGLPNWPPKKGPLKIHFVPGERFSYSGMAYSALQAVVEVVTGRTAQGYVEGEVLGPLGMANSRFVWTGQEDLPVAAPHNRDGQEGKKSLWPEMIAGASLHSTSHDFARFMLAVARPESNDRIRLTPRMTEEMLTSQVQVNDSPSWHEDWPRPEIRLHERVGWGLGWGIQHTAEGTSFWHWGDNVGYKHMAVGSRQEGSGIVIMTNGQNGQDVYRRILCDTIGGDYPGLDWLMSASVASSHLQNRPGGKER